MAREAPEGRDAYALMWPLGTRWGDNDVYGHVNNVVYYSWFDTAVNGVLVARGLLDIERSPGICLVVESGCRYHAPLAFPQDVEIGLRLARLGQSSLRWEIGVFGAGAATAAAGGHFVHVHVDRATRRPLPVPDAWRTGLADLL